MKDSSSSKLVSEINCMIEKSRNMRIKVDQDFLEYQNKVELELSAFLKETEICKSRIHLLISDSQLEYAVSFLEKERDASESFDCAPSFMEESSVSFNTSFLRDDNSVPDDLESSLVDDLESSLADDESQETAVNHYNNFQTRKEVRRRIRFSKINMLRTKTLSNLSSFSKILQH